MRASIYYRRELLKSVKNFLFIGVGPLVGAAILGYLFVKSAIDFYDVENSYTGQTILGMGVPFVIGMGFLLLGLVLLVVWRLGGHERFFGRKAFEAVDPQVATGKKAPCERDDRRRRRRLELLRRGRRDGRSSSRPGWGTRSSSCTPSSRRFAASATSGGSRRPRSRSWARRSSSRRSPAPARPGVTAEATLVPKRPAEALLAVATERSARLIVVGTASERPLTGVILGSVPHKLVHRSTIPVLVVPVPDAD